MIDDDTNNHRAQHSPLDETDGKYSDAAVSGEEEEDGTIPVLKPESPISRAVAGLQALHQYQGPTAGTSSSESSIPTSITTTVTQTTSLAAYPPIISMPPPATTYPQPQPPPQHYMQYPPQGSYMPVNMISYQPYYQPSYIPAVYSSTAQVSTPYNMSNSYPPTSQPPPPSVQYVTFSQVSERTDVSTSIEKTHIPKAAVKTKKKDPAAPKNPLSAYLFFVTEQRSKLAGKSTKGFAEMARELGQQWKDMSEEEKAPYQELAKKDKQRFQFEKKAFEKMKKRKNSSASSSNSNSHNHFGSPKDPPDDDSDIPFAIPIN
jgi:hypothetical protein